jgi:hypothetical protein
MFLMPGSLMPSIEFVAVAGLLLAWVGLLWIPLMVARVLRNHTSVRLWAGAALLAYGGVFLAYTATIAADASPWQEVVWSAAWAVPIALSLLSRVDVRAVWRRADLWLGVIAVGTFALVFPFLPLVLLTVALAIWG